MNIVKTKLNDCLIIEPAVFEDERGFFLETYQKEKYSSQAEINFEFVQDNFSRSNKNVLRGLHLQVKNPQGKLVRVVNGEVQDIVVDMRRNSSTFGEYLSVILSGANKKQLWVPPGFAHGFLVLSDIADFEYKVTNYYDPSDEVTILWNDPTMNLPWKSGHPLVSQKDSRGIKFNDFLK